MNFLFPIGLVLHICGITLMVGMTVAGLITYHRLFILLAKDDNAKESLLFMSKLFSRLQLSGALTLVLGGILMMTTLHGVIIEQIWFKIKLFLILLLTLNIPLLFRPAVAMLHQSLAGTISKTAAIAKAKKQFRLFYIFQLLIFVTIFILSVFRFN